MWNRNERSKTPFESVESGEGTGVAAWRQAGAPVGRSFLWRLSFERTKESRIHPTQTLGAPGVYPKGLAGQNRRHGRFAHLLTAKPVQTATGEGAGDTWHHFYCHGYRNNSSPLSDRSISDAWY